MKLFQNLTSGFRGEFWRISLHTVQIASLQQWPCLLTDHNFAKKFWKGSHKEQSEEIIPNSDKQFRRRRFFRISSCLYNAKCSHSPEPCLFTDQTFTNNFWKGSPKENSCEIISKFDQPFQRSRFFKKLFEEFLHVRIVQEAPFTRAMFMDASKFRKQFFKRVTQGGHGGGGAFFSPCALQRNSSKFFFSDTACQILK